MIVELDKRIRQELLETYEKLNGEGKIRVGDELTKYYETFRNKFGPEQLRKLDGETLLNAMHGPNKDSLMYWLEFKDDAEFPSGFGSIAGGSSFKFGLFRRKETGIWTTGSPQYPVELSLGEAIEKASQHRDQLLAGCELLAEMPENSDDEDYETLQQEMDRVAPDVNDTAWGHKYFSLLYPDKLDDYHNPHYQRFHLIKLLQTPPQAEGRYVAGDRYIAIANTLHMAVNTLSRLLNNRDGDPHLYWRIAIQDRNNKQDSWEEMRDGKYYAIGWAEVGDLSLSSITYDDAGRQALRAIVQKRYPDKLPVEIGRIQRQLFDFRWSIEKEDLVLASDGTTVLGVGKVTGDYYTYNPTSDFPHRRPVKWLSLASWQQPNIEGNFTTVNRLKKVANLIETERQILNKKPDPGPGNGNGKPPKLTWPDAIKRVLREASEPLRESEIASRALALGMQTQGITPERTVNKVLNANTDVFEKVGTGLYRLKSTPIVDFFADTKLAPVPEPLLAKLIVQLRRHLLVEEALVRRIYHALLNGHIILTGPPGTGKTELARLIPEILWQSEEDIATHGTGTQQYIRTAYTTTLVTATSEWSARTLISSIVPHVTDNRITYRTQYGHLTKAILRNWDVIDHPTECWEIRGRQWPLAQSSLDQLEYKYQGLWLIIDEFNRAPIDAALGEALTALSNGEALLVPIDGTLASLPLPKDFRIIGTLNSFDRNYLNLISEALKRRFAFIEVLPPTRAHRDAEQGIVLYKALKNLDHLSRTIALIDGIVGWKGVVRIEANANGTYESIWIAAHPLYDLFYKVAWPLFEVLRIYRQLGTAQAITLIRQWLTPGILQDYTTAEQWLEALDIALCDTLADQLQVLLPDELEILIWYLKFDAETFIERYNNFLASLAGKQRRLTAHLEALSSIVNTTGEHLLSDEDIEDLLEQEIPDIAPDILNEIFHLEHPPFQLPQFVRRLRNYKAEHGL